MSLQTRLSDLITAIGADVKAVRDIWDYPRREASIFSDFIGDAQAEFITTTSGGTATMVAAPDATAVGVMQLSTATASSNRAAVRDSVGSSPFSLAQGVTRFTARVRIPTLSDATQRYAFRVGFGDSDSADHQDGVYFEYDEVSSAFWRTKSAENSVRTTIASSVTVAVNTWYRLECEINAAGSEAKFYIDGTLVATHNAVNGENIPTTLARGTGFGAWIVKSVGNTARTALVDYLGMKMVFTTPR